MGMPGCGKSTFAKTLLDLKYAVVSTDEIRKRNYGSLKAAHAAKANGAVFAEAYRRTEEYLDHNVDVYFDATTLTRQSREDLRGLAGKHKFIGILFDNADEARLRNGNRDDDERVPEDVMDYMYEKLIATKRDILQEFFDQLIYVRSVR
jgi:predicted kinase